MSSSMFAPLPPISSPNDLHAIHNLFITLAFRAGHSLRLASLASLTSSPTDVAEKASSVDIVTAADLEAERIISEGLKEALGDSVVVIAEEAYGKSGETKCLLDDRPTVIVDPLDGTVNWTHLFPMVCVAIGYTIGKIPVVGVVYAPFLAGVEGGSLGSVWSSVEGQGAWYSHPTPSQSSSSTPTLASTGFPYAQPSPPDPTHCHLPILASHATPLPLRRPPPPFPPQAPKSCLLLTEWGKDRRDTPDSNLVIKLESLQNLASALGTRGGKGGHVHGVRSLGSSALDMCFVAMGERGYHVGGGCWEWDITASTAILFSSGGFVVDANPPPADSPLWDEGTNIPMAELGGRRYLAVRTCEGGRREQEKVIREIWRRVRGLGYQRPS